MSRSSITTEIDAVYARLETSGEGLDAFRQGGIVVREHAQEVASTVPLHELVALTIEVPTDNEAVEIAKERHPDEFELGAMVNAYRIRKEQS